VRLGIALMARWGGLEEWIPRFATAAAAGFGFVGVSDSQSVVMDAWAVLGRVSTVVTDALVGPFVTNTLTRHPAVTASAAASIDALTGGRTVLAIGRGGSAADNLSAKPSPVASTRQYLAALRALMDGTPAVYDDHELHTGWVPRPVPILVSASGPRMLELAGAYGDGIVFTGGCAPDLVADAAGVARAAAARAGRDPDRLEVWVLARASARADRDQALEDVEPLLSSAFHNIRPDDPWVPEDLRPRLAEMARRYDATRHVQSGPNVAVMRELGLTEYLADRFALVGTADECIAKLRSLERAGATCVVVSDAVPDPDAVIQGFGRDVVPAFGRPETN
jgi:5,10-methylenetetrahydromethanopterin reductase